MKRDHERIEWTVRLIAPPEASLAQLEESVIAVPGVFSVAIEEDEGAVGYDV